MLSLVCVWLSDEEENPNMYVQMHTWIDEGGPFTKESKRLKTFLSKARAHYLSL